MQIVKPTVDVWGHVPLNLEDTLKRIERAGRTCYDSIKKIKPDSSKKFVANVFKPVPPHASVLEHSNLVLRSTHPFTNPIEAQQKLRGSISSNFLFTGIQHDYVYLYGNWRAFFEEIKNIDFFSMPYSLDTYYPGYNFIDNLEDLPYFAQAATACFFTDRAVTHEMVRHRPKCAYSQRSQRYCSESNLRVIEPLWFNKASKKIKKLFLLSCIDAEDSYRILKDTGYSSQQARAVLPNCTATTIVVTAYLSEWEWIYYLRTSPAADPSIQLVMKEAKNKMIEMGIMDPE